MRITTTSLVFAAACLAGAAAMPGGRATAAQLVSNGPQVDQGDVSSTWSARQDVIASHRYDRLVATDPAFRSDRIKKECGPIADPQLHASCVASFNRYEPAAVGYGSSAPSGRHDSAYGR
jgi:hypothetical protein